MLGLVPAIHAAMFIRGFQPIARSGAENRVSSETGAPCHGVDTRHKAGHDADSVAHARGLTARSDGGSRLTSR
jgi:hypothetical protein